MTSMAFALVAVAILITIVALALRPAVHAQRAQHTNLETDGIKRELDVLLRRGYDGGYLIFSDVATDRFTQFRKYVYPEGQFGLETDFPRVGWTEPFYSGVQDVLRHMGIPYRRKIREQGIETINADFGKDLDAATEFAMRAFTEVFGLDQPLISATGDGISPFDETIDTIARPNFIATLKRALHSVSHQKKT